MLKRFRIPMILIHTPRLWVGGLTLFPFVFCKYAKPSARLINHERIHLFQQIEMGLLPFYIWYVLEFLVRLVQHRNWYKAYLNISFEREAYRNDQNLKYLKKRTMWEWMKYLRK
ncbi:MAG: hypothetical protein MUE30_15240 [Spirosomaceae bacterium]|jgi:hypothetical protein|nr:hypothetical protein [Spirosomataceae bacterium]